AADDTLQYYRSRRVLRTLADLANRGEGELARHANDSFTSLAGNFESALAWGADTQQPPLRDWIEPVRDLLAVTAEQPSMAHTSTARTPAAMTAEHLLVMLNEPDSEWAPKMQSLRAVPKDAYSPA